MSQGAGADFDNDAHRMPPGYEEYCPIIAQTGSEIKYKMCAGEKYMTIHQIHDGWSADCGRFDGGNEAERGKIKMVICFYIIRKMPEIEENTRDFC
jgi:hypothetical protein